MCAMAILLPGISADAAWFDGGHLTAAAAGLGVPHPTGFPLFCILGYAAYLIPVGTIPFKVALLSALCTAGAATLVYRTLKVNRVPAWMALLGAASLVFNFVVFLNGTLAEVYALTVFWMAALIALLAPGISETGPNLRRRWAVAALWTGLGLGAHVTFWLFAGLFWVGMAARKRRFKELVIAVPWGVWGAAIIAYLPVAAQRQPWLNWGDPSTLSALVDHLSASSIRQSFAAEMLSGAGWTEHASSWAHAAGGPLYMLWIPLIAAGWWAVEQRGLWLTALLLLVTDIVYATLVNPMGLDELQNGTPGALAVALLGALGAAGLAQRVGRSAAYGAGVLAAMAVVVGLDASWEDQTPDDLAGRFARLALADPLPGSLTVTASDHLAGQTIYLTGVEGYRADLETLVAQHHEDPSALVAKGLPNRPAFWQLGDGVSDRGVRGHLVPGRWMYRVSAARVQAPAKVNAGYVADVANLTRLVAAPGFRSRRVFSNEARLRATFHLLLGQNKIGLELAQWSVQMAPDNEHALLTLAVALARTGQIGPAIELLQRAVELAPRYAKAWKNLASFRGLVGDTTGAADARARWQALMGTR